MVFCWYLFVVSYSLLVVLCSCFVARCLLLVVCCLLFVGCWWSVGSLFVVRRSFFVVWWLLVRGKLFGVCCSVFCV